MNKPYQISSLFLPLVVKNKEGAGGREKEREGEEVGGGGGFITFFLYCIRLQINKTCMYVCMYAGMYVCMFPEKGESPYFRGGAS